MTQLLPSTRSIPLSDSVSMSFQRIPAGEFRMGSRGYNANEEPIHRVRITRDFYLGTFPVTQEQFAVWTQAAGIKHENGFPDKPTHPAENMDWDQAVAFCDWLTRTRGQRISFGANQLPVFLPPLGGEGRGGGRIVRSIRDSSPLPNPPRRGEGTSIEGGEIFRASSLPSGFVAGLPTEAQWEYACVRREHEAHLKSSSMEYYSGDGEAALAEVGWYDGNAKGTTHPVGEKKRPNESGLHDMHGNVWEWCRDAYDPRAYAKRVDGVCDPEVVEAAGENSLRVFRGGGWFSSARVCLPAFRLGWSSDDRGWDQGFRVCLFPGPVPAATAQGTGAS